MRLNEAAGALAGWSAEAWLLTCPCTYDPRASCAGGISPQSCSRPTTDCSSCLSHAAPLSPPEPAHAGTIAASSKLRVQRVHRHVCIEFAPTALRRGETYRIGCLELSERYSRLERAAGSKATPSGSKPRPRGWHPGQGMRRAGSSPRSAQLAHMHTKVVPWSRSASLRAGVDIQRRLNAA